MRVGQRLCLSMCVLVCVCGPRVGSAQLCSSLRFSGQSSACPERLLLLFVSGKSFVFFARSEALNGLLIAEYSMAASTRDDTCSRSECLADG